jgi:hypothetical protein
VTRRLRGLAVLSLVAVSWSCGDASTEPTNVPPRPGPAVVTLGAIAADEAAVSFTLTGPGVVSVRPAAADYVVYWRMTSTEELRVVLVGNVASGPLVTIDVADLNRLHSIRGVVTAVAERRGGLRDPTDYRLSLEALGGP